MSIDHRLYDILKKAEGEEALDRDEIGFLLKVDEPERQERLFDTARKLRQRYFGNTVFLYGFIYLSTFCRNDCLFCFYRQSNVDSLRYRRSSAEVLAAAKAMASSGVHLIDLTMGEDPMIFTRAKEDHWLVGLVSEVRRTCDLPVMVSPGAVPNQVLEELALAGASWFACYQETFNRRLFGQLRSRQPFAERLLKKHHALCSGLLVEEGLLCGLGESTDDLTQSVIEMGEMGASQMRAMTFVPRPGTPLASEPAPDARRELLLIAVIRMVYPQVLIPASLDVEGLAGLKPRMNAGANVVTSIVPPGMGLAGVAHPNKDIGSGFRTVERIQSVLAGCRLQIAAAGEYKVWLEGEQERVLSILNSRSRSCA